MQFYNFLTGQTVIPTDWQLALQVGDCYLIEGSIAGFIDSDGVAETWPMPTIYGRILEAEEDPGFFWVRAHSEFCPEGEEGRFCICDATRPLTAEEFQAALAALNEE